MKYRLYIDEYGNSSLNAVKGQSRFLSLTGVAFDLEHVRTVVEPQIEALKSRYFPSHDGVPVKLHRKELVQANYPYACLRDPTVRESFFDELFALLDTWEYTVFTTVIDKDEHLKRNGHWSRNPYHFCLEVILERYVFWLDSHSGAGDVIAEARGRREDRRLEAAFAGLYNSRGTDFVTARRFQSRLTSDNLKVAAKVQNIAGLQIADLMAYPAFLACHSVRGATRPEHKFNDTMIEVLNRRGFYRSPGGRMDGYGRKWLP